MRANGWPLNAGSRCWLTRQARWLGYQRLSAALGISSTTLKRAAAGASCYAPTHEAVRQARRP